MTDRRETAEFIRKHKLVAIARGVSENEILSTAQALYDGGIRCMEVALNHDSEEKTEESLRTIALAVKEMKGRMRIGAGTVLSVREVELAAEMGAEYIISPNTDLDVIKHSAKLGLCSMPGAFTPSEIAAAYEAGADFVKLFPAGVLGMAYIKAIRGPLNHIPLVAVGGVTVENCQSFLEAGCAGLGIGGNLVRLDLIQSGRFKEMEGIARSYTERVK